MQGPCVTRKQVSVGQMPMGILSGLASIRPQTAQTTVVWEAGKRKSCFWVMDDMWEAAAEVGSDFWVRRSDCSC